MKTKITKIKRTYTKKAKTELPYTATALIWGKKYTAKGASVAEAIANLAPGNVKGKCILILEKGDRKKERVLMPPQVARLFSLSRTMREVGLKQVAMLFDVG